LPVFVLLCRTAPGLRYLYRTLLAVPGTYGLTVPPSTRPTVLPYSYAALRSCPCPVIIFRLAPLRQSLRRPYVSVLLPTRYLSYEESTILRRSTALLFYGPYVTVPAIPAVSTKPEATTVILRQLYGALRHFYTGIQIAVLLTTALPRPTASLRHPTAFLIRNKIAVAGTSLSPTICYVESTATAVPRSPRTKHLPRSTAGLRHHTAF